MKTEQDAYCDLHCGTWMKHVAGCVRHEAAQPDEPLSMSMFATRADYDAAVAAQPEPAAPLCRTDGRCQYAIDHGAEGLGHCPEGKCAMPEAAPTVVEPVGWLEAPYGGYKQNPRYRLTLPPAALAWKIPLYTTPPRAALTDEELIGRAKARGIHDADAAICFGRAVEAALGHETNCMTKAREIEALRAAVLAEREACIERVKTCLYLDWEGRVLPSGPVLDANAEILRCVSAIRARKAVTP